jgi:hypothetical protein
MSEASASASWAGRKVLVLAPTPTEPLDFGNRKRIHAVCTALRRLGAEIHYVHYAAEMEWRRELPAAAARAMAQQWDSFWTVAPTRPLHAPPAGSHHTVDEWWDPAIGEMLKWLFSLQQFDALIVNYTWLTKAFEFAPRATLKILDTHDRFSGRKELLAENGVSPEFFYTTEEEERIALSRADLVWAIKEQEAAFFRELTGRAVLTLPHAEAIQPLARTAPPHGILRFGIVGARNKINLVNIRRFIEALRPFIERSLLPSEFHIAGSCCDDLAKEHLPPYVKLRGRFPELTDFYRGVDVVLAPMTFSTGLKIKVGEALFLGKALIGHEHAYEGYPRTHPFQHLPSLEAMLLACRDVVREPALIEAMEAAAAAAAATTRQFHQTLERTAAKIEEIPPGLLLVIALEDVRLGSLRLDHACEMARYLGQVVPIHAVLTGDATAPLDADALRRLARFTRLLLEPGLAALAGPVAAAARLNQVTVEGLTALCRTPQLGVWFASPPALSANLPRTRDIPAYLHAAAMLAEPPGASWPALLRRLQQHFSQLFVLNTQDDPLTAAARLLPGVRALRVPALVNGQQTQALRQLERAEARGITLLADSADDPLLSLTLDLLRQAGRDAERIIVPRAAQTTQWMGVPVLRQADFIREVARSRQAPALVLDTSSTPALALLREILDRHGTPQMDLFRPGDADSSGSSAGLFHSANRLVEALRRDFPPDLLRGRMATSTALMRSPGWNIVWRRTQGRRKALGG